MQTHIRSFLVTLVTVAATGISTAIPATAAALTWTFQNTVFDDGATLNGSFDYDADTNTYSNFNITATGATLPEFTYQGGLCSQTNANPRTCIPDATQSPGQVHIAYGNYIGPDDFEERTLFLGFSQLLTNQGGVVAIEPNAWGELWGFRGSFGNNNGTGADASPDTGVLRTITSGEVVANAPTSGVPEPTTMAGLALAGAGLAYARRRKAPKAVSLPE